MHTSREMDRTPPAPQWNETRGAMVDRLLPLAQTAEDLLRDDDSASAEFREDIAAARALLLEMQAIMREPLQVQGEAERDGKAPPRSAEELAGRGSPRSRFSRIRRRAL